MQHRQKKQKQQQMLPAERSGGQHPFSPPKPKLAALQRRAEEIKKDVATSMDQPPRPWITWNHPSICKRRPQSTYPVTASRLSMVRVNAKNPIFTCISRFFLSPFSHAVEDLLASFRCQSCTELADPPSVYVCPEGHVLCGPHLEELQRVRGLPSGKVPCFSCGDDARPSVTFIRIRALEETIAACRKEKEHEDIVKLRQEVSRLRLQGRSETRIAQVTKRL